VETDCKFRLMKPMPLTGRSSFGTAKSLCL
jgi:hypothetical protein